MSAHGETDFSADSLAEVADDEPGAIEGTGPWRLAGRRLRRNRVALAFLALFVVIVAACLAAPLYAKHVAKTTPNSNNLTGTIVRGGQKQFVVSPDGRPIGPGLSRQYLLGADSNGRDVMVRLLYGGRNSLRVGFGAAVITIILSLIVGLAAGYYRGWVDRVISNVFDIMWSFPVLLAAIALGTALSVGGLRLGFATIAGGSVWIPTIVIGIVYVPYLGRPIRGQVLALREREYVEAAVAQGMGPLRIMFSEILPNIASTVLVFGALIIANDVLTEAALSFLGAGIQAPEPSWGNLIADGVDRIEGAPYLALVPGAAIVLTVLSLNIFGDGLRDALDPRAKVRLR